MKKLMMLGFSLTLAFVSAQAAEVKVSAKSQTCLACHQGTTSSVVKQWHDGRHAEKGVGCYECHQAKKGEKDAMDHYGNTISAIVSAQDCAKCHKKEATEMMHSYHAIANKFTGSLDNVLGRIVTGEANFNLGCAQCHGSNVEVDKKGHPIAPTWPNNGIGRVNPDGSHGSCTACHNRHSFSVEQVRTPETCGKCHQGPDHPQIEIFTLSKHGIQYNVMKDKMNLDKHGAWTLGEDYYQAPNCVTCHMGAVKGQLKSTHNVGARIKWTLRPPVSKVLPAEPKNNLGDGYARRKDMKKVCASCHATPWTNQFFVMLDQYVNLYNNKFGKPAKAIIGFLKKNKIIDPSPFNEQVEWDFWHLWHHEGRRGRHGAAMQSPDFAHWHGIYEVAYNFYFHLIPHADKAAKKKGGAAYAAWKEYKKNLLNKKEHKWIHGLSKKDRQNIAKYYKDRYDKEAKKH